MSDNNIQVSVQWSNSTVFASEPIECTITFTNTSNSRVRRSPSPGLRNNGSSRERWKESLPLHVRTPSALSAHGRSPSLDPSPPDSRPFKTTLSGNGANGGLRHPKTLERTGSISAQSASGNKNHRRSISIVSIGTDGPEASVTRPPMRPRPGQTHGRAASMQIVPRRSGMSSPSPRSAGAHDRSFTLPSPFPGSPSSLSESENSPQEISRARPKRLPSTPASTKIDQNLLGGFRFPAASGVSNVAGPARKNMASNMAEPLRRALSPQPSNQPGSFERPTSFTKVLSPGSVTGTPRSSGEFFSMSNNSSETLVSEYPSQETGKMLPQPVHRRQGSSLGPMRTPRAETLMMGYAQVTGSLCLDGSLVNQSPFEEVKRKAIIGGQAGGGLVRSQSLKRESGLLGSFGWGSLGETFGGLLGDTGMSSIEEAKKSVSTKMIPVLSAPQSILFVDLRLSPGESKAYKFSHPIPRGSPPSHKGRAIKIQYNLVIGTQRPGKIAQQNSVRRVEIPFRVLPCINGEGDVLGHDLMSPHVLLSNSASVRDTENVRAPGAATSTASTCSKISANPDEFLSYIDKLLEQTKNSNNAGLLSPTEDDSRFPAQFAERQSSMKERIDMAILKSSASSSSRRNVNRFEINRSGEKVAVIVLSRPSYRLGESIPIVIDLNQADIACYSLHTTLESSESVDPAIALRSKASIQRVTRKIHASHHESTISANRVFFNPMIPTTATPEFITSSVNLEWKLRLEFVTAQSAFADPEEDELDVLMEEIARDDRGTMKAAVQGLPCETFEVAVPLRVYGATAASEQNAESGVLNV